MKFQKGHEPLGRSLKGHETTEETKGKIGNANRGKRRTDEVKGKISAIHKGVKFSEEHKRKIGLSNIGKTIGSKNAMSRPEVRLKQYQNTPRGIKNPNWKGGLSFEPYSIDWTETLKRSIRERDKYICKLCGIVQNGKTFDVHHIDYDKKNCDPNNLITLCNKCHTKTSHNREYWIIMFTEIMLCQN